MQARMDRANHAHALLSDFYQLTMAYGYWRSGKAEQESVFYLLFRKHPFQGGFTLACGLADAVEYLRAFRFENSDLEYLATMRGGDGGPLFDEAGFQDAVIVGSNDLDEYLIESLKEQLARFHPGIKRFTHPHQYPAGLESGLHELETQLILRARPALRNA
jgi:nicotinic acid phosphoribosyltransferase